LIRTRVIYKGVRCLGTHKRWYTLEALPTFQQRIKLIILSKICQSIVRVHHRVRGSPGGVHHRVRGSPGGVHHRVRARLDDYLPPAPESIIASGSPSLLSRCGGRLRLTRPAQPLRWRRIWCRLKSISARIQDLAWPYVNREAYGWMSGRRHCTMFAPGKRPGN
jgi:hypothetical protein